MVTPASTPADRTAYPGSRKTGDARHLATVRGRPSGNSSGRRRVDANVRSGRVREQNGGAGPDVDLLVEQLRAGIL